MSETLSDNLRDDACDIAAYEVSEDGVTWRPFDPLVDEGRTLHRRIEFAPPSED
jgi:hypothetical protein